MREDWGFVTFVNPSATWSAYCVEDHKGGLYCALMGCKCRSQWELVGMHVILMIIFGEMDIFGKEWSRNGELLVLF